MFSMAEETKIGNLNGKWSLLLRWGLSTGAFIAPSLLALNVWLVNEMYQMKSFTRSFIDQGPRYTAIQAERDRVLLKAEILSTINSSFPQPWLVKEIESLSRRINQLELDSHKK